MGQAPSSLAPPKMIALPVPSVKFTGPTPQVCTWADYYKFCSLNLQSRQAGAFAHKYKDTLVHWHGILIGVDSKTNSVLFKMTPTLNQGAAPDLALHFPATVSVSAFASHIVLSAMKTIDFVARLVDFTVHNVIVCDYVSVGGSFNETDSKGMIPPVKEVLAKIPPEHADIRELDNQLSIEYPTVALECSMQGRAMSEQIFTRRFLPAKAAITGQVADITPESLMVKCNPQNVPGGAYDIVCTYASASLVKDIKKGSMAIVMGAFKGMAILNQARPPTVAIDSVKAINNPKATLEALPTRGGDVFYEPAEDANLQAIKKQASADAGVHRDIRGSSATGSVSLSQQNLYESSSVAGASTGALNDAAARASQPSMPSPSVGADFSQAPKGAGQEGPEEAVEDAPREADFTAHEATPAAEDAAEDAAGAEAREGEEAKKDKPMSATDVALASMKKAEEEEAKIRAEEEAEAERKRRAYVMEAPTVVIEEAKSEFANQDPLEVALKLMQNAPEASYIPKAGSILDNVTAEADDPLARLQSLKSRGFNADAFTSKADTYLDQLSGFAGAPAKKVDPVADDYYDIGATDTYGQNNDQYGDQYGNYDAYGTNNYDQYGSGAGNYGGNYDNYGGGSGNYGNYNTDYNY